MTVDGVMRGAGTSGPGATRARWIAPVPRAVVCAAGLLLAACTTRTAGAGSAPPPAAAAAQPAEKTVPVADHHTHLFNLSIARVYRPPVIPGVQLPEGLDRLLRAREASWNDTLALAALYTEDSALLDTRGPRWIQGRGPAASYIGTLYAQPYRIAPIGYAANDSTGHITGYFTSPDEASRIFGYVHLSLRRGSDGAWRIAAESATFAEPNYPDPFTADKLIALLDAAGIRRAAVLSTAYWFGSGTGPAEAGEYEKVRAETEWVAEQVGRYPDRLVGLCSFNPLKDYALDALARCAADPRFRGLKQHFGDSGVDLRNPEHVAAVLRVFRAANEHRLPIVVDLRTSDPAYGAQHSRIFLDSLVAAAPDIAIQIAHLAGSGPGYNSDEAFAVFAEAAAAGDPRMRNVYTDVATVVTLFQTADELALIARRLRQFGLQRVLYGSDHPASTEITPETGWLFFRRLPLTDGEFRTIAHNLAPYLR
ncbi:amidohydrolase family protein [Longimicrobium sp.]|uniref:amidohydrolase family protein n=1 Tax=Longimicrobium sp. TaxID=2029185 RepID=UPI003B3BE9B7